MSLRRTREIPLAPFRARDSDVQDAKAPPAQACAGADIELTTKLSDVRRVAGAARSVLSTKVIFL